MIMINIPRTRADICAAFHDDPEKRIFYLYIIKVVENSRILYSGLFN